MTARTATAGLLALLDSDPAAGILASADRMEHDASLCSLGGGPLSGWTPNDSARLVEWMLAAVRRWRGVVERHDLGYQDGEGHKYCGHCFNYSWPCPDVREVADEARAYVGPETADEAPAGRASASASPAGAAPQTTPALGEDGGVEAAGAERGTGRGTPAQRRNTAPARLT